MLDTQAVVKAVEGMEKSIDRYHDSTDAKIRELSDDLLHLKQRGTPLDRGAPTKRTMGALLWQEVHKNADLIGKTGRTTLSVKAATDPVDTSSARSIATVGVGALGEMTIGLQHGLPKNPLPGNTVVEYSRYSGVQGAAAVQATEGAQKAALRPDHTLIQQASMTIAGYTKISKQALTDQRALESSIDVVLRRSLEAALDSILWAGSGTWPGYSTLVTSSTSTVYDNLADAASEGVATMLEAGFVPNIVSLRPSDWLIVQTARNTNGDYLAGPYLAPLPELLRGLRLVLSPSIPAGKVLVADAAHLELHVVDDMTFEIDNDSDDFTKNLRTILGELRVVPTFSAVGAARLITPMA